METCNVNMKKQSKRKFCEAWLSDDRYKDWIQKVSNDTMFYCNVCNKTFSCSSHVSRDTDSVCHQGNIKENRIITASCRNNPADQKNACRKQKFRPQWLDTKDFTTWLREVQNKPQSFFCTICDRIMVGGLSQIYDHAESDMHKSKCGKSDTNKSNEDLETQTDESLLTFDERKKFAEIRFAALIAEKNIPHQTAKEILSLLQDIGKDPNVLKNMSIGPTKCKSIISNVLCPAETEDVVSNIQNTKFSIF